MSDQFLYGLPGAEVMYFDPATVYESEVEPWYADSDVRPDRKVIEEWSVHDPTYHLPDADSIVEWMAEWAADGGEMDENGHSEVYEARKHPDVIAAAEALRQTMGAQVKYRMSNRHLRDLTLTWDEQGEPLLDGKPMYVRRSDAESTVVDLLGALEASVKDARAARKEHQRGTTPRQRWGTCCPRDPACDHSYLDNDALTRWMDSPLSDELAAEFLA